MHRVDYTAQVHIRGDSRLSRTMIREGNIPGITDPDLMVNWVDVRDVGKWVGTCFEYPGVFSNENLAGLDRVHPRWTFERELEFWGINDLKPGGKS